MAEGRSKLAEKLQKDIDEYVSNLKPTPYKEGWPEDKWEQEMGNHPFFMDKPVVEGQNLPPLVEALQQLKYDPNENTPEELAKAYKDEGNLFFKVKKYQSAVDSYSEGLKHKCTDKDIVSQLFANRAAAHFHIGNYKKSLNDSEEAKTLNPGYMKAIYRGAECCLKLKLFEDCILWCEEGLQVDSTDTKFLELKEKTLKDSKIYERDRRKAALKASRTEKEMLELKKALWDRNIKVQDMSKLIPANPLLTDFMVHLDEDGCLVWPVVFLYPEYGLTDGIQCFHEDSCFADFFEEIFSEENRPAWDEENKYYPNDLQAYFACGFTDSLVPVDKRATLKSALSDRRFTLFFGTPVFSVTVKDSKFDEYWRQNGPEK